MGENTMAGNRRGWVRNRYWRASISWRLRRTGQWQRGWLIDVSTSGVSLFVPQEALPETGQEIEVRFLHNKRPLPYSVVRVEPSRGIIGCRIVSVENRRSEPREYCPDVVISWRSGLGGTWRMGRLCDTSARGLALHVMSRPPRAGEEIELARRDTGRRAHYRVLRSEVCDGKGILLACRMVAPESCQAQLPPPEETQSSSRRPSGRIVIRRAA